MTKEESHYYRHLRAVFIKFCNFCDRDMRLNSIKKIVYAW
jgi:hypothetical protein